MFQSRVHQMEHQKQMQSHLSHFKQLFHHLHKYLTELYIIPDIHLSFHLQLYSLHEYAFWMIRYSKRIIESMRIYATFFHIYKIKPQTFVEYLTVRSLFDIKPITKMYFHRNCIISTWFFEWIWFYYVLVTLFHTKMSWAVCECDIFVIR